MVCEGGPTLFGGLIGVGLVDELFLTSPRRSPAGCPAPRLALVEGSALGPDHPWAELGSVMRAGNHLFLRYRLYPDPWRRHGAIETILIVGASLTGAKAALRKEGYDGRS